jgi:hypothetical protein
VRRIKENSPLENEENEMRRQRLLLLLALLLAVTLSFTSQPCVRSVAAEGANQETQPVYTTPDGFLLDPAVPGAYAKLTRNQNGIRTNVQTSVLGSGDCGLVGLAANHRATSFSLKPKLGLARAT